MTRTWIILIALLGLMSLAGCPKQTADNEATTAENTPAAVTPQEPAAPAAPLQSPLTTLSVTTLDGSEEFTLDRYLGKPLVVNYFAMY